MTWWVQSQSRWLEGEALEAVGKKEGIFREHLLWTKHLELYSGEVGFLPTSWMKEQRLTGLGSFPELQKPGGAGMQVRPMFFSQRPPAFCTGPLASGGHSLPSQVAQNRLFLSSKTSSLNLAREQGFLVFL